MKGLFLGAFWAGSGQRRVIWLSALLLSCALVGCDKTTPPCACTEPDGSRIEADSGGDGGEGEALDTEMAFAMIEEIAPLEAESDEMAEMVDALRADSSHLIGGMVGDRLDWLMGAQIGTMVAEDISQEAELEAAAMALFSTHRELFRLSDAQMTTLSGDLQLEETGFAEGARIALAQSHQGLPVFDGGVEVFFSEAGAIEAVLGAPFSEDDFPDDLEPDTSEAEAANAAIAEARDRYELEASTSMVGTATLGLLGMEGRLVYQLEIDEVDAAGAPLVGVCEALVDAETGAVLFMDNGVSMDSEPVLVRGLLHRNGRKDDSDGARPLPRFWTLNVDVEPLGDDRCQLSLARNGSGHSRIWNFRVNRGLPFGRTIFERNCNRLNSPSPFLVPQESARSPDPNWQFNEQQTYVQAQRLKTAIDAWGRAPGQSPFGQTYQPRWSRRRAVDIVVNANRAHARLFCDANPNHGCFTSRRIRAINYEDYGGRSNAFVPTVFLFNQAPLPGRSAPQFVGPEYSASYPIVAHEVGHYINWTYGGFDNSFRGSDPAGRRKNLRSSLREGHAMTIAALFGKWRWSRSLDYEDSQEVTSGAYGVLGTANTPNVRRQWFHARQFIWSARYDELDCTTTNAYVLAWPWVQAMWELVNNVNIETGERIWQTDRDAIANTTDLFMYTMWFLSNSSRMSAAWNLVANTALWRMVRRIEAGSERGLISRPWWDSSLAQVRSIFRRHGLFSPCMN